MDIGEPLRELGEVDSDALREAILRQGPDAWNENEFRQEEYDVHRYTESIVLLFTDGSNWPDIEVSKQPGWNRLADVALPLMEKIVADHYEPGGTIIRAMAAKLLSGGRINPHYDSHPSFFCGHRIHVPITTNPRVRFMIEGRTGLRTQQPEDAQRHEQGQGRPDHVYFRLRAAGTSGCSTSISSLRCAS
jgi:hypothetical protein